MVLDLKLYDLRLSLFPPACQHIFHLCVTSMSVDSDDVTLLVAPVAMD